MTLAVVDFVVGCDKVVSGAAEEGSGRSFIVGMKGNEGQTLRRLLTVGKLVLSINEQSERSYLRYVAHCFCERQS